MEKSLFEKLLPIPCTGKQATTEELANEMLTELDELSNFLTENIVDIQEDYRTLQVFTEHWRMLNDLNGAITTSAFSNLRDSKSTPELTWSAFPKELGVGL
ncbi:MAG: hypothetical protein ABW168_00240 [Sedimenticola sp.]